MTQLYIFDLDETTGIYSSYPNVNDRVLLRPGFKETVELNNKGEINMVVATRGYKDYVESIKKNLAEKGIELKCRIYTEQDVETELVYGFYKDYRKIFTDNEITHPEKECVVIGDLLKIGWNEYYTQEQFMQTDFQLIPNLLTTNCALNDHPYPYWNLKNLPVYVVLPRMVRNSGGKRMALNMLYVLDVLKELYESGDNNFAAGFERTDNKGIQKVVSDELAQRLLNDSILQRYVVVKGEKENWSELEEAMQND